MSDLDSRPRLILTFHSQTQNGPEGLVPFILSWSQQKGTYQLDETQTKWLLNQSFSLDRSGLIAQVRLALKHYQSEQKHEIKK